MPNRAGSAMPESLMARVYANWFYAGATAAAFMLALTPLLWGAWDGVVLATFLQLSFYMVHQVEEYYRDRFRTGLNAELGGGREVLTPGFALLVNLGGIWLVDLVALYLAYFVRPGLGLIAMYLSVVNAVVHVAMAFVKRAYNPGLVTATLLLLPGGLVGWWLLFRDDRTTGFDHAWGLGIALGIHVAIVIHLFRRIKALNRSGAPAI